MGKKITRAGVAGKKLARAIIEMVNLMYQKNTANNFLTALVASLIEESVGKFDRKKPKTRSKK